MFLKLLKRLAQRLLASILFLVGIVIPRSRYIWAFGSWYGLRFADNSKHFFIHCSKADLPVRAVWLSRSSSVVRLIRRLGFRAHHWLSPLGLWYSMRAGVYLVDCRIMDVSPVGGSGATIVNLWHGIPLKKIERDIDLPHHPLVRAKRSALPMRILNRLLRPELSERYDFVLATSKVTAARLGRAFGVAAEQLITAGYPRTDLLFAELESLHHLLPEERDLIGEFRAHATEGRRILLYMPTFRDWNNIENRSLPVPWEALDAILEKNDGVLYCKFHPIDQAQLPSLDGLTHIRVLPADLDVYPALKFTDALITDYSSILFDYLLLDRPILFYPYDLEEYQRLSRGLYDPYDDVTPGPKARTAEELQSVVASLLEHYPLMNDCWREHRVRVRRQIHEFADARSSERLATALLDRLAT